MVPMKWQYAPEGFDEKVGPAGFGRSQGAIMFLIVLLSDLAVCWM